MTMTPASSLPWAVLNQAAGRGRSNLKSKMPKAIKQGHRGSWAARCPGGSVNRPPGVRIVAAGRWLGQRWRECVPSEGGASRCNVRCGPPKSKER